MAFHRFGAGRALALASTAMLAMALLLTTACSEDKKAPPAATATDITSTITSTDVPSADPDVDQQTLDSIEESARRIEDAFRSGDVDAVVELTHPSVRASYQSIFEEHAADLKRVADLLATRKLVGASVNMAEYEVTENGETFYVTLESWGEQWFLASL